MWDLRCLLCGARPQDLPGSGHGDLVRLQEHLMEDHQLSREGLRSTTRETVDAGYVWRVPDGRLWLEAIKRD